MLKQQTQSCSLGTQRLAQPGQGRQYCSLLDQLPSTDLRMAGVRPYEHLPRRQLSRGRPATDLASGGDSAQPGLGFA